MGAWMRSVGFIAVWFVLVVACAGFVAAFVGGEHCADDVPAERRPTLCDPRDNSEDASAPSDMLTDS